MSNLMSFSWQFWKPKRLNNNDERDTVTSPHFNREDQRISFRNPNEYISYTPSESERKKGINK